MAPIINMTIRANSVKSKDMIAPNFLFILQLFSRNLINGSLISEIIIANMKGATSGNKKLNIIVAEKTIMPIETNLMTNCRYLSLITNIYKPQLFI